MMHIPLKVCVRFGVPGIGQVQETYSRLDVHDVASWQANEKMHPQISIEEVAGADVDATDGLALLKQIAAVAVEAKALSKEMLKNR